MQTNVTVFCSTKMYIQKWIDYAMVNIFFLFIKYRPKGKFVGNCGVNTFFVLKAI